MIAQRKCKKFWWLQWLLSSKVWATNSNEKACEKHQWTVRKKVLWDYFWSKKKEHIISPKCFFHLEVKTQKKKWLNFGLFWDNSGFEKDWKTRGEKKNEEICTTPSHARILVRSVTPKNIDYDEKLLLRCKISTTTSTKAWNWRDKRLQHGTSEFALSLCGA